MAGEAFTLVWNHGIKGEVIGLLRNDSKAVPVSIARSFSALHHNTNLWHGSQWRFSVLGAVYMEIRKSPWHTNQL